MPRNGFALRRPTNYPILSSPACLHWLFRRLIQRQEVVLPLEQPRARISIDGVPIAGLVELEIDAGGYFLAGRFQVGFALSVTPAFDGTYFASLTNQNISIEVAPDGVGYVTLLLGRIDAVRIEWGRNIAFVFGRDLTGLLIDTEIAQRSEER